MRKLELLGCLALNRQLRLGAVAELPNARHPPAAGRQAEPHRAGAEGRRRQARPLRCLDGPKSVVVHHFRPQTSARYVFFRIP